MVTHDSPEEKSSSIPMVEYEDMDEVHFQEKTHQKLIDQQHTWQDM